MSLTSPCLSYGTYETEYSVDQTWQTHFITLSSSIECERMLNLVFRHEWDCEMTETTHESAPMRGGPTTKVFIQRHSNSLVVEE